MGLSRYKNREPVTWPIEPVSAHLLETYITRHRPQLAEAGNRHLFPSEGGKHRSETEFGAELSRRVEWDLGAAFNVHLVRHFAVARCLRANPGCYEMAARIVGHRSIATTMRYYSGLEFDSAARHPGLGTRLRPITIRNAMRGYGRFLSDLEEAGDLILGVTPSQRTTPPRMARFVMALRREGNVDNTIKVRLFDIRVAIRIMEPKAELTWLTRPGGHSLDSLLPQEPKDLPVIPSPVLYQWGIGLMDRGAAGQAAASQAAADEVMSFACDREFRDGLIIAILACRAPRLRALAGIRIGQQLQQIGEEFWLCFAKTDIKNRKAIEYSLPEGLTPYIHKYLGEVHPRMLGLVRTDWLWVTGKGNGSQFMDIGIEQMIRRRSLRRFGHAFGPHRFRHALATTLAEEDSKNPGLAAALLGVAEAVVAEHYRKAKQGRTARLLQKDLAAERDRTRLLAERELNPELPEPAE